MTEENKHIRFAELLELHINTGIKNKFKDVKEIDPVMMREIRDQIRGQINAVFDKSKQKLTDKARSWLTDQFFKNLRVNEDQKMSDLIVLNEFRLDQLTYEDIELLKNLFDQTTLAETLQSEYSRRMQS
jgi:hypothetical protein